MLTPVEARTRRAQEAARRRSDEQADALDFLVYGDEGDHADRCIHAREGGEPCSRDYDALPYSEAAPHNPRDYVGTGVGALYGIPGGERLLWLLAGWNVRLGRAAQC